MKRIFTTLSRKWSEYLLEILVLIIGIYGAFALESWNEDRKEKILLSNQLTKISEDLAFDRVQLKILALDRTKGTDAINQLVIDVKNQRKINDSIFSATFLSIVVEKRFIPNVSGMNTLEQSQTFEQVVNSKFQDLLIEYRRLTDEITFLEERQNDFTEEMENYLWINGFYPKAWQNITSFTDFQTSRRQM